MANGSFKVTLAKFAEKAKGNADKVIRKTVLDMGTSLVYRSPVGDASYWQSPPPPGYVGGRFRGNWQVGVGSIDYTTTEAVDAGGEKTVGDLFAKVSAEENAAQVWYLTNSLPYSTRLENGWSRQAPQGMVGVTVLQFKNFISEAVAGL